jgi:plasmid segregation protein ParM
MKLIAGMDVGNGYVKATVKGREVTNIDIPSCMVEVVTNDYDIKPDSAEAVAAAVEKIYDDMDLSFESPLIPERGRFWFGRRAVRSDRTPQEFDINAVQKKFRQSLTTMLTFGCLAAKALDEYYKEKGDLPKDPLLVEVCAALALPISEYKRYHEEFAQKYMEGTHTVHVHNFNDPVTIVLKFVNVKTTAEGASAQYGIASHGESLVKAMLADVRGHGIPLEGYEPKHIIAARGIMGVDIGEGTVNFPVFTDGRFNTDVSATLPKGYGEVIDRALSKLRDDGRAFNSRKELTEYLNNTKFSELPLVRQREYKKIVSVVDAEITGFVSEVTTKFAQIISRVGTQLDVIYVYGGGATPVKNELYDRMLDKVRAVSGGEVSIPVLYLDSWYSRYLNREGLFALAETAAEEADKK